MIGSKREKGLLTGFIDKLRRDRRLETAVYAAVAIAALVIFASAGGISCDMKGAANSGASGTGESASIERARTESETEARLAEVLSGISGAGKVTVMVSLGGGTDETAETDVSGLLSYSGTNAHKTDDGSLKIEGVIVIAEGADDIRVRTDIQSAVRTLLGIPASRIGVYKMQP